MFRRGKLTFQGVKDDRIKIIHERINLTEKHLIEICTSFGLLTRKMAKYRDSFDDLARSIKGYSENEEVNENLSQGLKSFTNAVTILGDYMDLNVRRLEIKVVNEIAQFESICKTTRENLRSAVICKDKEMLKQRQMLEIKAKFSANNSAADSELLKTNLEVNRANKEIDDIIYNFEKRKLNDIKAVVTDFILIMMKFHTKSLEALSASYYDVSSIDEKDDFVEFQKLMKPTDGGGNRGIRKGIRSKSMDNLDSDKTLSPLLKSRISRSSKTLDTDDNYEDESDDRSIDEDETESFSDNNEDDRSDTTSEEDVLQKQKRNMKTNEPFKVATAKNIHKKKTSKDMIFSGKSGIGLPMAYPRKNHMQFDQVEETEVSVPITTNGRSIASSRLQAVVESKK